MNNPELGGQIPFFLESFLSKPASALPKGAQWILVFEGSFNPERGNNDYNDVLPVPAIKKIARSFEPQVWDIDGAIDATLKKDYQTNIYPSKDFCSRNNLFIRDLPPKSRGF